MLQKFIILCLIATIFSPIFKLSDAAVVNKANNTLNISESISTFEADNTWQPIIQTHNWLQRPTTLTAALPVSAISLQSLNLRNNMTDSANFKIYKKSNTQIIHSYAANSVHRQSQNYGRNYIETVKPAVLLSSPIFPTTPLQSVKEKKSKPPVSSLLHFKNDNRINNSTDTHKYLSNVQYYHHQQQEPHFHATENNKIATTLSLTQMPKIIMMHQVREYQKPPSLSSSSSSSSLIQNAMNRKYSMSTQVNFNNFKNIPKHGEHTNSFSSNLTYRNYTLAAAQHIQKRAQNIKNTSNTMKFELMANNANNTNNILPTKLNYFATKENLIDNSTSTTGGAEHQYQSQIKYQENDDDDDDDDDKNCPKIIPFKSPDEAVNAAIILKNNFNDEGFSRNTLQNAHEFYNNFRDRIWSDDNKSHDSIRTSLNDRNADGNYKLHVKNDDTDTNDDKNQQHQLSNSSSHELQKDIRSLHLKNIQYSVASRDEVKGRKRQIGRGHLLYSLIKPASLSLSPSSENNKETQNEASKEIVGERIRAPVRNVFIDDGNVSIVSVTSAPLKAITAEDLSVANSSGRKIKKSEKKFQKFLFPLLLAYKLKYMTLLPLLMGGLILLMGSTGLAGFFFALFTAVMSLKSSGHRDAILVNEY